MPDALRPDLEHPRYASRDLDTAIRRHADDLIDRAATLQKRLGELGDEINGLVTPKIAQLARGSVENANAHLESLHRLFVVHRRSLDPTKAAVHIVTADAEDLGHPSLLFMTRDSDERGVRLLDRYTLPSQGCSLQEAFDVLHEKGWRTDGDHTEIQRGYYIQPVVR